MVARVNRLNQGVYSVQSSNQSQPGIYLVQLGLLRSHRLIFLEPLILPREADSLAAAPIPLSSRVIVFSEHPQQLKVEDSLVLRRRTRSLSRRIAYQVEAFSEVKVLITNKAKVEGFSVDHPRNKQVVCLANPASPKMQACSALQIHSKHSHSNKLAGYSVRWVKRSLSRKTLAPRNSCKRPLLP